MAKVEQRHIDTALALHKVTAWGRVQQASDRFEQELAAAAQIIADAEARGAASPNPQSPSSPASPAMSEWRIGELIGYMREYANSKSVGELSDYVRGWLSGHSDPSPNVQPEPSKDDDALIRSMVDYYIDRTKIAPSSEKPLVVASALSIDELIARSSLGAPFAEPPEAELDVAIEALRGIESQDSGRDVWVVFYEESGNVRMASESEEEANATAEEGERVVRYVPSQPPSLDCAAWVLGTGKGLAHGTVCIVLSDEKLFLREFHPTKDIDGGNWWPLKGLRGEMFPASEVTAHVVTGPLPPPPKPEEGP